jgi:hypothetical protein
MTEEIVELPEATLPEQPKTKLQLFIERLSQYPNEEEAKRHIAEIAQELGCAKSLGYKALRKVERFQPKGLEAKEPTVKIPSVEPEELEEIEEEEEITPAPEIAPTPAPSPPIPSALPLTPDKLSWSMKLIFEKIGNALDYPDFALTQDEADKLAEAWLPVLNKYVPEAMQDPTTWCAITTVIIVAPRVIGYWKQRKQRKEIPKEEPKEQPKEQPKPETTTETEKPKEEPTPTTPEPPKKPAFLEKL